MYVCITCSIIDKIKDDLVTKHNYKKEDLISSDSDDETPAFNSLKRNSVQSRLKEMIYHHKKKRKLKVVS